MVEGWDSHPIYHLSTQTTDADNPQSAVRSVAQAVGIFFIVQFASTQLFGAGNKSAGTPGTPSPSSVPVYDARPNDASQIQSYNPIPQYIAPIWPMNSTLEITICVSPSATIPSLRSVDRKAIVVEEKGFQIGDWNENREIDTSFAVPKEVQSNGTLWGHFFIGLQGYPLDPNAKGYNAGKAFHFHRALNQVRPKKKVVKTKNLLSGSDEPETPEEKATPKTTMVSYYHPNFTMSIIPDSGTQSYPQMHPAVRQHVHLESTEARDASGQNSWYYPILFVNTFWQLRDHMTELNSTVTRLPLHIKLNNLSNWKFSLYASIDEGMKQNQNKAASGSMPAGGDGSEFEEFKRVLVDTNVYLLSTTFVVSILHMIFEMLAFKSDIVSHMLLYPSCH